MNTPICDFVRAYAAGDPARLHMPGHKGAGPLGIEAWDITEIPGADVLYSPTGIIRESQQNAATLFGTAATVYSTEGSSLCIRAMVQLAALYAKSRGKTPRIAAGRNAHGVFHTATALLDVAVDWLTPGDSLLACPLTGEWLEDYLSTVPEQPTAVYITSPDYLGNRVDLAALAAVCHRHDALLLVDNAHGAYLRFLPTPCHPMNLGADLCCDSAHKTLGALTGGAYLHIGKKAPTMLTQQATAAMALFASTSPSYVILQSLDALNPQLAADYPTRLAACAARLDTLKERLAALGWAHTGDEPLKLTLAPNVSGYTGDELGKILGKNGLVCEASDPQHTVCMFTPKVREDTFARLEAVLIALPRRTPLTAAAPTLPTPVRRLSSREALLSPGRELPVAACVGRVLASPAICCPPAVPVAICGEEITPEVADLLTYYAITHCRIVD